MAVTNGLFTLALDFGVNLAPDAVVNEPAFNVHFNIGLF